MAFLSGVKTYHNHLPQRKRFFSEEESNIPSRDWEFGSIRSEVLQITRPRLDRAVGVIIDTEIVSVI